MERAFCAVLVGVIDDAVSSGLTDDALVCLCVSMSRNWKLMMFHSQVGVGHAAHFG